LQNQFFACLHPKIVYPKWVLYFGHQNEVEFFLGIVKSLLIQQQREIMKLGNLNDRKQQFGKEKGVHKKEESNT
jgi:hypothetical protein